MKTPKQSLVLFLGMLFMLAMTSLISTIASEIKVFILMPQMSGETVSCLKYFELPAVLIVGVIFIGLTVNDHISRGFQLFFWMNTFIFTLFAVLLAIQSPLLAHPGLSCTFSVWMALATILTPVFVWGYGNQEYTFSLAAIQYPILAFCIILLTPYCNQLFILAVAHSSFALIGSCLAALASLLILGTFFIMKHCDKGIIEPGIWLSWKYWAAIGSLVFGIGLIKFFPDLVLKDEIHTLFSTPEKYVEAIGQYASTQGLFLIYVSIAGILLGAVIYTMGFQSLAPCGFLMLSGLIAATIVGIYSKSWESNMVGFAFSTSGIIIFTKLIKELTFFAILHKNRIAAKLFVDVLIAMLAAPIARLFVTAVQHFTIIQAIPIHLYAIGFAIGMILCLFALTRIHHYVKAIPHH